MCVVSMIADHYNQKWPDFSDFNKIGRKEFEDLKKEVKEMKELLRKAKIYDEANGEPNCEMEDKMKLLRKVAEAVGIDLDEVLKTKPA